MMFTAQAIPFAKYEGLGNDFIILDARWGAEARRKAPAATPELATKMCDRHFGIGADGTLTVLDPDNHGAVARMKIHNADGSIPQMCGNGIRCFAKYLYDTGSVREKTFNVDTDAGRLNCTVSLGGDGLVESVRVAMGPARFNRAVLPMLGTAGKQAAADESAVGFSITGAGVSFDGAVGVSMGNPHLILWEPRDIAGATAIGPAFENHEWFPERTNVEFVRVTGPASAEVVVWERGCGITLACGTGACGVAAAGVKTGRFPAGQEIAVTLPGGTLAIEVQPDFAQVLMRGPARHVFDGAFFHA
jgi:diaminopimelate epimerase